MQTTNYTAEFLEQRLPAEKRFWSLDESRTKRSAKEPEPMSQSESSDQDQQQPERVATCLEDFEILSTLGSGTFGCVYKARNLLNGRTVALKVIKPNLSPVPVFVELEAMQRVSGNKYALEFYSSFEGPASETVIEMQYVDGKDLFTFLSDLKQNLSEVQARHIFKQMVRAVQFAHSRGIIHRDLKPENFLIRSSSRHPGQYRVKLIDYGLAKFYDPKSEVVQCQTCCGSLDFAAPELVRAALSPRGQASYDGRIVESWALGVILFELTSWKYPFVRADRIDRIRSGLPQPRLTFVVEQSTSQFKDLVRGLTAENPEQRIHLANVLSHPWFAARE